MAIKNQPRQIIFNDTAFTEAEVKELSSYFPELDMVVLERDKVRGSVLQKALACGAVLYPTISKAAVVTLHITPEGRELIKSL